LTVGYSTKALRNMAGSKTLPAHKYGRAVGAAFHARLADVWAARTVAELPLWETVPDILDRFLVPVAEGCVLVFEANHAVYREAGTTTAVNWRQVIRVKLLEVRFNG
jgi:hypothetical protein